MRKLIALGVVGALLLVILAVAALLATVELRRWWIVRVERKIRKRRDKLRMLREQRGGKV
jgi:hypothetical protein